MAQAQVRKPPQELSTLLAMNQCKTEVKVHKVCYMWTISDFSLCTEVLISSPFPGGTNYLQWCLLLNPAGLDDSSKDFVSLHLHSCNISEISAKFTFSIVDAQGEERNAMSSEGTRRFEPGMEWGCPKFIRRDILLDKANGLLPGDKMTILCEISVVGDRPFHVPESRALEDFSQLFETQKFTDVSLSVNGRVFKAHKAVLSARSSVFRNMFQNETAQSNDHVEIKDFDDEVVADMLRFIYTDQSPNFRKTANHLLAAADKYGLERLKVICQEVIGANLSVDNALDTLILADLHSAGQLKAYTIDFINKHAADMMDTPGWKNMFSSHPQLFMDTYRVLVSQQSPGDSSKK